jgi:hypothetical protein
MTEPDHLKLLFGPPSALLPMVSEDMDSARWARAYLIACASADQIVRI